MQSPVVSLQASVDYLESKGLLKVESSGIVYSKNDVFMELSEEKGLVRAKVFALKRGCSCPIKSLKMLEHLYKKYIKD